MAPGRMPRRQGARWSAALFQFITRDKPAAHKTGPLGFACCGVRNYSPPGGGGGGGGAGGAPVGAPVPVPVPVVVPVVLPLSPCTPPLDATGPLPPDRKSTRLNSSHLVIS